MNELNDKIRLALSEKSSTGPIESGREESIRDMVVHSFRGQSRWLTILAWVKIKVSILLASVAVFQFFRVDATRELIAYASLFVVACTVGALWWMWYYLVVQRNVQAREIKRLELRIARLASQTPG